MRVCETCHIEKDTTEFIGGRRHCKKCNRAKYNEKIKDNFYFKDGVKLCSICNTEKTTYDFRPHRTYCKKCENKKTYENRKDIQSKKNKEYIKAYQKENKDKINKRMREYNKSRCSSDINYKLRKTIGRLVSQSIKLYGLQKSKKSLEIIGLSTVEFRNYLESKFEPWMNWDNYGLYNGEINYGWDIDHIIPLSSATTEEELLRLNYYTNLQPLCSYTNRYIKKDIIK